MRIAISVDAPGLETKVEPRFGTSQYLLIVDPETMTFESIPNPGATGQRGAGMQAVALAISKKVDTVLTGYCSPNAKSYLSANGIEVLTGVAGTVAEVVERYRRGDLQERLKDERKPESRGTKINKVALIHALKSSANQFANLLPILIGVVLLIMISYFGLLYMLILTILTMFGSIAVGYSVDALAGSEE